MVVTFLYTISVTGLLHLTADGNGHLDYCRNLIHPVTQFTVQHVLHIVKNGVKSWWS
jgi:hypothetical protein